MSPAQVGALLCPLSFLFLGLLTAGVLGFLAFRSGRKAVLPADPVKCKVAEMRDGDVCRVKGRLVAREAPLKSPLTNKECVFYSFQVQQAYETRTWRSTYGSEDFSRSESWRPIIDDAQSVAVMLEDDTGTARLDLKEAHVDSAAAIEEGVVDTGSPAGLQFELLLQKRYGESTLVGRRAVRSTYTRRSSMVSQKSESRRAKMCEKVLENGIAVIVLGEVEVREGKSPRFRPKNFPLVLTVKGRQPTLPAARKTATTLWIAAGAVLGVTLFLTVVGTFMACGGGCSGLPLLPHVPGRPFPGH